MSVGLIFKIIFFRIILLFFVRLTNLTRSKADLVTLVQSLYLNLNAFITKQNIFSLLVQES